MMTPPPSPRVAGTEQGYGPTRSPSDHSPLDPSRGRRPQTLPYGDPSQVTVSALTRVMSPNTDPNEEIAIVYSEANQHVLLGMQSLCQVCGTSTPDPSLCAHCGLYGHPACIGLEFFQGFAFCRSCMSLAAKSYAEMQDSVNRQQWQTSLVTQIASWRERARNAAGVSASIGIAVGGVAATAANAACAAAQGLLQGASSAASGSQIDGSWEIPTGTVPSPREDPTPLRPDTLRRSSSTGDLAPQVLDSCPRCLGDRRATHTYRGMCKGLPASVYFARGVRKSLTSSPGEHPPPVAAN